MKRKDDDIFYTCFIIEKMGRQYRQPRSLIVEKLGKDRLEHIVNYADVLHCENHDKTVDEYACEIGLTRGTYDTLYGCEYKIPSATDIAKVYKRLIEDTHEDDLVGGITNVFCSFLADYIDDYNRPVYFASSSYLAESYKAGYLL